MEALYLAASVCYEAHDYEQSALLFTSLVQEFPFEAACWKGLASSEQMRTNYEAALCAWGVSALLNDKDPWVHFHAAECYLSLGNYEEAQKALSMAETLTSLAPHEDLASKLELLKTIHTPLTSSL